MSQKILKVTREDALREAVALIVKAQDMSKDGAEWHEFQAFVTASQAWSAIAAVMQPNEVCSLAVTLS